MLSWELFNTDPRSAMVANLGQYCQEKFRGFCIHWSLRFVLKAHKYTIMSSRKPPFLEFEVDASLLLSNFSTGRYTSNTKFDDICNDNQRQWTSYSQDSIRNAIRQAKTHLAMLKSGQPGKYICIFIFYFYFC